MKGKSLFVWWKRITLGTKFTLAGGLVVILALGAVFFWAAQRQEAQIMAQVDRQARILFQQIVLTRAWIADMGGVYAEKQGAVETNPYLLQIPGLRVDIQDTQGTPYTLRNPALVTRELSEYAQEQGAYAFHITSLKLINPNNAPTPWERTALERFEREGLTEATAIDTVEGERVYRYMAPLYITEGCLKCHAAQGYQLGDVRGGISVMIPMQEAEAAIQSGRRLYLLAGLGITTLVIALLYFLIHRLISRPLHELEIVAQHISEGDLARRLPVRSQDELGSLAGSFNRMTEQLRESYATLEEQVAERTRDLERRAVQLATAADVGRAAVSILEIEALARRVVDLTRERFDLYYVGLFLLDEAGEYAVLEAGSGEAGRVMKEQGHRLRVGGVSMVGAACAHKEARIALDVGAEPVRFDNPLLPDTHSEMALPLIVGDRVLGALDVQSTKPAAFSPEDITVLQLVADQVAVAVDNARKFSEEAALLEAASPIFRASRRLTTAVTTDQAVQAILDSVSETEADGCMVARLNFAKQDPDQIETITFLGGWRRQGQAQIPIGVPLPPDNVNIPALTTFWTMEDVSQDAQLSADFRQFLGRRGVQALVNVPLRAGERVIGFVVVSRATPGPFSPVALQLYEMLADQAAVALERAHLLEETQRRAAREQAIRRISDRVTASFDLDTILQTAVETLGRLVGADGGYVELGTVEEGLGGKASVRR